MVRRTPQPLLPISNLELLDFLGSRYAAACGSSTLASMVSAVAYDHRVCGLPDPTADFRVKQLLAGARRLRAGQDRRLALSLEDITRLCTHLQSVGCSPVERAAYRALIPLAFFLLLRPGEVVLGANPHHTLQMRHIQLRDQQLTVTVPSSKTSAAPFTAILAARSDIAACPVAAMREYLAVRGRGAPANLPGSQRPPPPGRSCCWFGCQPSHRPLLAHQWCFTRSGHRPLRGPATGRWPLVVVCLAALPQTPGIPAPTHTALSVVGVSDASNGIPTHLSVCFFCVLLYIHLLALAQYCMVGLS